MSRNKVYPVKRCNSTAKNSGNIWVHRKRESKLVKNGSNEYNELLDNGYYVDRAVALGIKKPEEEMATLEEMTTKELKLIAKEIGVIGYGNASRENIIKMIEEKENEEG